MTSSIRAARTRASRSLVALASWFVLAAMATVTAASADLVVFTDGHFLRVEGYEVVGDRARISLDNGGLLTVSLRRVDRVIEDEEVVEEPPSVTPTFGLRFVEGQHVPDVPYGDLIHDAAQRHGLNPDLVAAVARAESAFRADAVSVKGARGLMQLMPATAEWLGVESRYVHDPELNLDAGARYLRRLADKFEDDLSLVLAAYNAGEGTVARYGGVPPYRETRDYLKRIFGFLGLDPAAPVGTVHLAAASR